MKRGLAAVASLAVAALTLVPAGPANAAPQPRGEEWWFAAWGIQKMAWPQSTGREVTVAVVDSGVNARLPELRGAVVPGFDATGGPGDGRKDTDTDLGGHGTAMAALIAGQGGPARMVGVAPDAKIMPIVSNGYADDDTKAIRYAVDHGAKVVSISQSSPNRPGKVCEDDLQQAIAYAAQKNVVVVAAAGNEGQKMNTSEFPASCAGVLAVGAIDNKLKIWPDTERQSYVAAAAPGWGVGSINKAGHFMNNISGTSQAAALTSAAVALIRAKYPDISARELVQRIIATAVDCGPPGVDNQTGAGAVLPPPALTKTVDKNAPNPPFERLDKWLATQGKQSSSDGGQKSPAASGDKSDSGGGSGALLPLLLLVVLVAIVVAVIVLVRRRRAGAPVTGENAGHAPGQYAGAPPDRNQGPPPSFGPPGGQGAPPYGGPPPGHPRNTPPAFRPPDERGGPTQH